MRSLASLAVLSVALTGCTFGDTEPIDPDQPAFMITVTQASSAPGHCVFDNADYTCHTLRVVVDNTNNEADLPVGAHVWEADDGAGGVYGPPIAEGPDAVASGATRTITVAFSVDEDGITLQELRYEARGESAAAVIPAYA